jgi:hypothetical protein
VAHLPSRTQLKVALQAIGLPGGRQLQFIRAHFNAPGRARTARNLAKDAKYQSWRGINLQYGLLAEALANEIGVKGFGIEIILTGAKPKTVTNREWVLIMRPEFADALKQAGWVK